MNSAKLKTLLTSDLTDLSSSQAILHDHTETINLAKQKIRVAKRQESRHALRNKIPVPA